MPMANTTTTAIHGSPVARALAAVSPAFSWA